MLHRYNRKIITRNDNIFSATFVNFGNVVIFSGILKSIIEKTTGRMFASQQAK